MQAAYLRALRLPLRILSPISVYLVYVANALVLYCKSCLVNELNKNSVAVALYRKGISTGNTLPNFFPVKMLLAFQ